MSSEDIDETYKVKITGKGMSVDRTVSAAKAREILNLIMGGTRASNSGDGVKTRDPVDGTTPKTFIAGKRPKSDVERVTCLAYYLAHHRNTTEFKTADITKLNTEAAQPKFSNATVPVNDASSAYKFLSAVGRGKKQITVRGEAVVEALPDRDAVTKALDDHPIKGGRSSRKRRRASKEK